MYCEVCGRGNAERHHIIFRSQGGKNFQLNYKDLCYEHHRGDESPHKNKEVDLKYKIELQTNLERLLEKEHYTLEELIKVLGMQKAEAVKTFRHLRKHPHGYARLEIIFRLLGDKFYR